MSAKTKKGKRYTAKEKSEILAFANKIDKEKGRGGQAAACKKYKISALTISNWRKQSGASPASKLKVKTTAKTSGSIDKKLDKLKALYGQIQKTEKDLDKLKAQFNTLKKSL